jgi:hypothetical protein
MYVSAKSRSESGLPEASVSTGLTRSEAIRRATLDSAGQLRRHTAVAAEAAALDADEDDRQEMLEVAEIMENMRAPR